MTCMLETFVHIDFITFIITIYLILQVAAMRLEVCKTRQIMATGNSLLGDAIF